MLCILFFFRKKRLLYVYHIVPYLKYLLESIHRSRIMDRYIQLTNKSTYLFYTYWFLRGNLSLAFLQSQEKIPGYVSRAHGYDLYDEQQGGLIPFRIFKMKYIKYLFPVSKLGANYVKKRIPKQFRGKVRSAYLGTKDHGLSPFNNLGKVTIVSCSNIIPLKRIPLIIDVLSHLNIQVNWHHFGDGISENQVKLRAKNLPKNVQYKFWGRINNTELIAFYKKNHITLFLNLSTTEGIPVSIMEAISFGIPVIATDVGGVHEIVNSQTGVLVDKDAMAENIADVITGFVNSDKNSEEFRSGVRQFWKRNFDAEKNYPHFITFLKNIDYQSV